NWQTAFDPPLDPSLYPQLQDSGDYNQPAQIEKAVDDIIALQDAYRVGEVRLHTAFLFDPAAASDPLALPFRLDRPAGVAICTDIAMHGRGTFTEFTSGTQISFLNFNYTTIKEPNAVARYVATNTNAVFTEDANAVDTDGDGLTDAEEQKLQTC